MKKPTSNILLAPRITEKGAYLSELGCYVFDITQNATKHDVSRAVFEVFKVTPRKVTVLGVPRKQTITRGTNRTGVTARGKKAYVFLKKGETIELV
jgi:ribosomal protein L23